jgi:hypothetical protein
MQIRYGEVLRVIYTDDNPNLLYGIEVKILNSDPIAVKDPETSTSVITAKPLNINFKRMPIVGEIVALLNAPTSYSSGLRNTADIYYFSIVSAQSNIHHNAVPTVSRVTAQFTATNGDSDQYRETSAGNTNTPTSPKLDTNFTENSNVQSLQPYVGDVIIEGRYGNSIRFSTSPKSGTFTLSPRWEGGSQTAPITIIRNTLQSSTPSKINGFTTENFNTDDSSIVLSSGQELEFEVDSKALTAAKANKLTSWQTERFGTTPQILSTSGRILLNSRLKEIGLFSKSGILLSTDSAVTIDAATKFVAESSKIELGNNANEPLILGNAFNSWMNQLVTALSTVTPIHPVVGPCLPLAATPQWPAVLSLLSQIPTILSQVAFTKRIPSASSTGVADTPIPDFKLTPQDVIRAEQIATTASIQKQEESLTDPERIAAEEAESLHSERFVSGEDTSQTVDDYDDLELVEVEQSAEYNQTYIPNTETNTTIELVTISTNAKTKGIRAVEIALRDIGIVETPNESNSGPRINQMLNNVGCRPGNFWCAAATSTWWLEAGITDFKSASCSAWLNWAKQNGRFSATPVVGSLILFHFGRKPGADHIGIVAKIDSNGTITTIEGNTSKKGQNSNGGGVFQKVAKKSTILGFVLPA